jgi:hypothetical protein
MRQYDSRFGVFQHECEAFDRIRRVQRQIAATGFQYSQYGHHHIRRALGADAHQDIRADTSRTEVACHTLGARIQIVIADASTIEDNGCLLRRGRCPQFEQPMRQLWFHISNALSFS